MTRHWPGVEVAAMVPAMMGRGIVRTSCALVFVLSVVVGAAAATGLPPDIDQRIAEAARAPNPQVIGAVVIEAIAARPDLVERIVLRAARAAPAYSARIAADAAHAFPAFAPRIASAASTATPEQAPVIIQVTSEPRVAASQSAVTKAVESSPAIQDLERSNWAVRLAAGVAATPEYQGAENYELRLAPLVDVSWRGRFFLRADGDFTAQTTGIGATGLGWNFVRTPNWAIGTRLTADYGRDNDLDRRLAATRTVDPEAELGLFFDFYGGAWNLGGDVRQGLGVGDNSHEGFLAEMHVAYAARIGRAERIYAGLTTTYAGPSYMRTYFNSGTFKADSGLRDAGAFITVEHDLSRHVFARLVARGQRLLFDAGKSPVTDRDSKNQFYGAIQLGYKF